MVKNTIFGFVALVAVVALIASVGPAALADGAKANAIDNESVVVDYGNKSSVDEDGVRYGDSVTITNNGATLDEGTDYDWHQETGNVTWYDQASTADGDQAEIDYTVYQVSDTSRKFAQMTVILLFGAAIVAVWIIGEIGISGRF